MRAGEAGEQGGLIGSGSRLHGGRSGIDRRGGGVNEGEQVDLGWGRVGDLAGGAGAVLDEPRARKSCLGFDRQEGEIEADGQVQEDPAKGVAVGEDGLIEGILGKVCRGAVEHLAIKTQEGSQVLEVKSDGSVQLRSPVGRSVDDHYGLISKALRFAAVGLMRTCQKHAEEAG